MLKNQRKITLTLTSLLIIGAMLVSTIGALAADGPFNLVGPLNVTGGVYKVGTQVFVLGASPTCTDLAGATMLCSSLVTVPLVQVKGQVSGTTYTADSVALLNVATGAVTALAPLTVGGVVYVVNSDTLSDFYALGDTVEVDFKVVGTDNVAAKVKLVTSLPTNTYTYQGAIVSTSTTLWKVGLYDFAVDSTTTLPEFYAVNDIVKVTFKIVGTVFQASKIEFVSSDPNSRYEYEGVLSAVNGDIWTVGAHDFNMSEVELPIYFGVGDTFKLQFRMEGTVFFTTEILEHTVLVPNKVESSRCVARDPEFKIPSGILNKLGAGVDETEVRDLFCKGFGWGEIMLAFRYADGSAYTPEMLLALRAQGHSWGDLRKLAAGTPAEEPVNTSQSQNSQNSQNKGKGNSNNPGITNNSNKHDNPNKPTNPGNSNGKGKGHNK